MKKEIKKDYIKNKKNKNNLNIKKDEIKKIPNIIKKKKYENERIVNQYLKILEYFEKRIINIESLLQNQLYAEITLGTPEQKIYLSITTETDSFSIESKSINDKFYIHNKSSSYINTNKRLSFYHERYKEGYVFKEKFYFKNLYEKDVQQPYNNISFNYILELSEDYKKNEKIYYIDNNQNQISGTIGLQILKTYTSSSHFINSLSYIGAINKNIWSLIYSDNEDNEAVLYLPDGPRHEDQGVGALLSGA